MLKCHHRAVLSADRWPDDVAVPALGRAQGPDVTGALAATV
jgi:hypothetical protein